MSYQESLPSTQEPVEAVTPSPKKKVVAALLVGAAVFATVGAVSYNRSTTASTPATELDQGNTVKTPPPSGVNHRDGSHNSEPAGDDDEAPVLLGASSSSKGQLLVDKKADSVTLALYQSLQDMSLEKGVLFGHQVGVWFLRSNVSHSSSSRPRSPRPRAHTHTHRHAHRHTHTHTRTHTHTHHTHIYTHTHTHTRHHRAPQTNWNSHLGHTPTTTTHP